MVDYIGIVNGKQIVFEKQLPYPEGQAVRISIEPLTEQVQLGAPAAIREVMHEPPHLASEDVDELERQIERGKLPVMTNNVFDEPEAQ